MEQYRHALYHKVKETLKQVKTGEVPLTELHLMLLGFSKRGKQSLAKSQSTWQFSFGNAPGGIEYICRYWALHEERDNYFLNPESVGLGRGKSDVGTELSFSSGDTTHIKEFVRKLPQWPELGYKPNWGKWKKNSELSNTWNTPVLAVLYEIIYEKPVHIMQLVEELKTREFEPTCQFNLCNGNPGLKHPILTKASRAEQIEDFRQGKPAKLRETKELMNEKPKIGMTIKLTPE
ncbi:glycosyl transferase [Vibrio phage vB_VpS_PG07]|uniref:Glycosyl transferase n=1 Tax=Vibrio phage vB_VpS_PG07 TaxID=2301664 RepID=A0A385E4R0_9CAUD|nr:glycosyl transferase [Vibrio phage vB_VpS_PG07]AXQ66781.1 glycosyl transferase [Vibrio phage vB_VpS_PG07]